MTSKVFTAVAVEVLARRVIEQAILCSYIAATEGSEVIDRFLKTSASEFQRSWQEEHTEEHLTEDASLPVKQLPNYQQMAASRPQLYELYQRFSYLSHPRGAYPYSAAERDNRRRGTSFQEYYRLRCEVALASLAESINVIREIFEAEYAVWSQDSLGRA
jgi:hypothetical protein